MPFCGRRCTSFGKAAKQFRPMLRLSLLLMRPGVEGLARTRRSGWQKDIAPDTTSPIKSGFEADIRRTTDGPNHATHSRNSRSRTDHGPKPLPAVPQAPAGGAILGDRVGSDLHGWHARQDVLPETRPRDLLRRQARAAHTREVSTPSRVAASKAPSQSWRRQCSSRRLHRQPCLRSHLPPANGGSPHDLDP